MNYILIKKVLELVIRFEESNLENKYPNNIIGFKKWLIDNEKDISSNNYIR